jgi:hypothetical protein
LLRAKNFGSRQIGREQVRGELDAVEIAVDTVSEHLDRARFRKSRSSFNKQMTIGEQCDEQTIDQGRLSHDMLADMVLQPCY